MGNVVLGFIAVALLASAGSAEAKLLDGQWTYTPPQPLSAASTIPNVRDFAAGYDATWRAVVSHLSDTAFVIDNIDKDSGLITVSFSLADARVDVDCGSTTTWVKNLRGRRDYAFEGAAPYAKYEALDKKTLVDLERRFQVAGKFNIFVVPTNDASTRVKVTTRYVGSLSLVVSPLIIDSRTFQRVSPSTITDSVSFNTGEEAQFSGGSTRCRAKGSLEDRLLNGVARVLPVN